MGSGGLSTSRWGLRGSERISDELTVSFRLESSIAIDDGDGGDGFNRDSWIGLEGPWGELRLGNMLTPWNALATRANGGFDAFTPVVGDLTSSGGGVFVTEDQVRLRPDNLIVWRSPRWHATRVHAAHTVEADSRQRRSSTLGITHETGPLSLTWVHQREANRHGRNEDWSATQFNGTYEIGQWQLMASLAQARGVDTRWRAREWQVGFEYDFAPNWTLSGSYARSKDALNTRFEREGHGLALRYRLSSRTQLYAGWVSSTETSQQTRLRTGRYRWTAAGIRHAF